jgi:SpoVK/Ycf46/Vps4 family AAA+-type ATPase
MSANPKDPVARPALEGRVVPPGGRGEDGEARIAIFEVETPRRRLEDLVLPDDTLAQVRALLTKVRYHQVLYEDFGLKEVDPAAGRTALNLYGPPGTGKSFAAEAIARELGLGLIRVNYAEVESKYVGETAKNIRAAFQKARESGAALFFDEADSILGRRLTNVRQSTDHAVNISRSVMLLELDRFSGVTLFATNLASNYDPAFVRRILGHIEMPLPDAARRAELWGYLIPARMPVALSDADRERLVTESEGLSGGELLNIVINAAALALEREGPACQVRLDDFLTALGQTRRAKQAVEGRAVPPGDRGERG